MLYWLTATQTARRTVAGLLFRLAIARRTVGDMLFWLTTPKAQREVYESVIDPIFSTSPKDTDINMNTNWHATPKAQREAYVSAYVQCLQTSAVRDRTFASRTRYHGHCICTECAVRITYSEQV